MQFSLWLTIVCLLGANFLPYYGILTDVQWELVELAHPFDSESEKEEKTNEKELDDKLQMLAYLLEFSSSNHYLNSDDGIAYQSVHHPEVDTPPPELAHISV